MMRNVLAQNKSLIDVKLAPCLQSASFCDDDDDSMMSLIDWKLEWARGAAHDSGLKVGQFHQDYDGYVHICHICPLNVQPQTPQGNDS